MGDAAPVSVRGDMRLVVAEGEAAEAERRKVEEEARVALGLPSPVTISPATIDPPLTLS